MQRHAARELDPEQVTLGRLAPALIRAGLTAAGVGLGATALLGLVLGGGLGRMLQSYLVAFSFCLTLGLGALFFVIIQHLVRAGWSVTVRRLAESVSLNLPLLAVLFIPVLLGLNHLYSWADAEKAAADVLIQAKAAYLNLPFFLIRWVVYFLVWSLLARFFWIRSVRQDQSGDPALTRSMEKWSGPAIVAFALTVNFAGFDLLMSLEPHWYSTIYGVYFFSGSAAAFFALLSIMTALLHRSGRLGGAVTDEHYHDLGKLVFAFIFFWAYIGFSQYMLIWYANIPEETSWYLVRQNGSWAGLSLLMLFGHFLVPFFYLLPRFVKRRPKLFGPAAAWILLMHYGDLYWQVMPNFHPEGISLHLMDLTAPLGVGGLLLAAAAYRMRRTALVPLKDPRLAESLTFENA